jgi:cell division protein FtsN
LNLDRRGGHDLEELRLAVGEAMGAPKRPPRGPRAPTGPRRGMVTALAVAAFLGVAGVVLLAVNHDPESTVIVTQTPLTIANDPNVPGVPSPTAAGQPPVRPPSSPAPVDSGTPPASSPVPVPQAATVIAAPPRPTSGMCWYVHLKHFDTRDFAQSYLVDLQAVVAPVKLVNMPAESTFGHSVRAGPFETQAEAEVYRGLLAERQVEGRVQRNRTDFKLDDVQRHSVVFGDFASDADAEVGRLFLLTQGYPAKVGNLGGRMTVMIGPYVSLDAAQFWFERISATRLDYNNKVQVPTDPPSLRRLHPAQARCEM